MVACDMEYNGDVCHTRCRLQEQAAEKVLTSALTDRARVVRTVRRAIPPTPLSQLQAGLLRPQQPCQVLVGARVDPTAVLRQVVLQCHNASHL